ncbi:CRISP/Allergen/PR-1-like [Haemaphysalis longicornis]
MIIFVQLSRMRTCTVGSNNTHSKATNIARGMKLVAVYACIYGPDCRTNREHTLCKRPNPACIHKKRGLEPGAAAFVLKMHNDFRSKVALGQLRGFRPAADMQELVWDDELAEVAQAHAELCTDSQGVGDLQHDQIENRATAKFPQVGQNLADEYGYGRPFPANWTVAVEGWTNESVLYPAYRIAAFNPPPGSGHFTQVIWAKTRYLGCGFLHYYVRGRG